MIAVISIHAALAVVCGLIARRVGPKVFVLAALAPLSGVVLLISQYPAVTRGQIPQTSVDWIPGLDLTVSLRMDGLSALMLVLVSGVGAAIFVYTAWYARADETLPRLVWQLTAFAGAMVGLVLADDIVILYVFWELTTIVSYLLVGLNDDLRAARIAARQALLLTASGGLIMLAGLLMLAAQAGSTRISVILQTVEPSTTTSIALGLVLVGALMKSAQFPFHSWLPGAMAAPTPVSAYLHAAAMVKAGIYLLLRFTPVTADLWWWQPTVVSVGLITMIIGGWRALRYHDLKQLLAFSTVSQLGFLTAVAGWGTPGSVKATGVLLLAHAFAKAGLFMTVGIVDHQANTRDLRRLSGLGRRLSTAAVCGAIVAASMAGVIPLLGFIAKETVLEATLHDGDVLAWVGTLGIVIGSVLTTGYAARFWWGAFGTKDLPLGDDGLATDPDARTSDAQPVGSQVKRPSIGLIGPVALTATASVIVGLVPGVLDHLLDAVIAPVDPTYETHLAVWHGFTVELGLSTLALVGGAVLVWQRRRVALAQRRLHTVKPDALDADALFEGSLRGLRKASLIVTGATQTGSLPAYLGTIMATVTLLPLAPLVWSMRSPQWHSPLAVDTIEQWPVVLLAAVAAVLATVTRERLPAVLLLGGVGYAVALLFVIQGAPDLALTQFLVETLTLVVFLFVLRQLPSAFPPQTAKPVAVLRVGLAVVSGVFVTIAALAMAGFQSNDSVAQELVDRSYSEGHGQNVVNVILVDFRGLDTLGEASVVLAAALGVLALVLTAGPGEDVREQSARERVSVLSSTMLTTAVRAGFYPILITGLFFLFAGHNRPGGGFIGGLTIGSAFVLRYLAAGPYPKNPRTGQPEVILGIGLVVASAAAITPMLLGEHVMTSYYTSAHLPVFGYVSFPSVLIFDSGVLLIVVGIVLAILRSLGERDGSALGVGPKHRTRGSVVGTQTARRREQVPNRPESTTTDSRPVTTDRSER